MKSWHFKYYVTAALSIIVVSIMLVGCSSSKRAVAVTGDDVTHIVDSSNFTFVAERMNPLRHASRILTSYYDVELKKDTLQSFLPYFGRSFQAPVYPSKSPLEFTSTKFEYNVTKKNPDQLQVSVTPKDNPGVQQLLFTIFNNGTATLDVSSTNRDPVSFYGHIQRNK